MYGWKSINGSVEWLGVPTFLRNDGLPWADNILCPSLQWGVRGTYAIWYLESQSGGRYSGVDVPWCGAAPARAAYLPWSPENARATARRIYEALLREHRLAIAQSTSNYRHIIRDKLVNWKDCALDDLWDEPAPQ